MKHKTFGMQQLKNVFLRIDSWLNVFLFSM